MIHFKMQPIALSVSIVFLGTHTFAAEAHPQQSATASDVPYCYTADDNGMKQCSLSPIVVTASAPQSTHAFYIKTDPKKPIQPVPASDGADYLKNVGGFSAVRNGGSNGDPVFRGMFGSRLKIVNNGSEMLGACPARMDSPTSYIAPANFDEIDIVKGPQTVLWGAASAVTVNFKREQPTFDDQAIMAEASVMLGSNGRLDSNLDSSLGNDVGYVRLLANTSEADDYKDGRGKRVKSEWRKWNTDVAFGLTPTKNTWLELSAGAGDGEAGYAGRGMDGSQFKRESMGLKFEQTDISDVFSKLEAQVNYNNADHVMDNYTLRTPTAMDMGGSSHGSNMDKSDDSGMDMEHHSMPMSGVMMASDSGDMHGSMGMHMSDPAMAMQLSRETVSGRIAGTFDLDQIELITGLDANSNTHQGRMGGRDYKNSAWAEDAEFNSMGWFGEATWQASNQHNVVLGARVDQHKVTDKRADEVSFNQSRKETLNSGFARLESQLPAHNLTSYIGVGYVERMPDYWELFSPTHYGNTNAFFGVKPEKNTQLDMGFNYQYGSLKAWTSAYVGQVSDYILMSYAMNGTRKSASASNIDATTAGAEAGVSYAVTDSLTADINLAYAWGRNEKTGKALPQIAPLDTRLGLNYHQNQYSVGALWRLVSAQNRVALDQGNIVGYDLGRSDGFSVFSFNGAYQLNSHVNLSVGVDNVFDKTYAEHLNKAGSANFGYANSQTINDQGRNYWAKLSVKY